MHDANKFKNHRIEKENIELGRLGKTLKNVPKYISRAQLTDEIKTVGIPPPINFSFQE